MFEFLKKILKGNNGSDVKPESINVEEYLQEIEELNVEPESEKLIIKVCDVYDENDAINALVLVEAGYIVIAKIPNIEKEADDEFLELLKKVKNEVTKMGGLLALLGNEYMILTPKNCLIERVKKEIPTENIESEENEQIERDIIKEKITVKK